MFTYPTDIVPTVNGVLSYVLPAEPEGGGADPWAAERVAFAKAQSLPARVDRLVFAFDALKDRVSDLDVAGLAVVASCAQQIVLHGFYMKQDEALPVRDAAIARGHVLSVPAEG